MSFSVLRSRLVYLLGLAIWVAALWSALHWASPDRKFATSSRAPFPTKTLPWSDFFAAYILPKLPIAEQLDSPVRAPDGQGVFITLPFLEQGHLGEDWATAKGDASLGEPVTSPGDGWVSLAQDYDNAWGKVVFIVYRFPDGRWPPFVEMLFAQMNTLEVKTGDFVKRGQRIGTIGTAGGTYHAHLHWEVRQTVGLGLGGGFSDHRDGWLEPSDTLRAHRGDRAKLPLLLQVLPPTQREGWGSE